MNDIKCRGKRLDNGEEVKGYYCKAENKHFILLHDAEITVLPRSMDGILTGLVEVDPSTVQRFICKDKNEREVWSGDQVRVSCPSGQEQPAIVIASFENYVWVYYKSFRKYYHNPVIQQTIELIEEQKVD